MFGHIENGAFALLPNAFDGHRRMLAQRLSAAMMAYWGEFARRGDPGFGNSDLPRWHPWTATGANVLLLDALSESNLHMAEDRVDRAALLEQLAQDPAAGATVAARCNLLRQMIEGGFASFDRHDYDVFADGRCEPAP